MEMLNVVTYPQKPDVQGADYGKANQGGEKKDFSDVLEQEISRENSDAGNGVQDKKEQSAEAKPEIPNLAALLWLSQNPLAKSMPADGVPLAQNTDLTAGMKTAEAGDELVRPIGSEQVKAEAANQETADAGFKQTAETAADLTKPQSAKEPVNTAAQTAEPAKAEPEAPHKIGNASVDAADSDLDGNMPTDAVKQGRASAEPVSDEKVTDVRNEKQNAETVPVTQTHAGDAKVFSEPAKSVVTTSSDQVWDEADVQSLSRTLMNEVAKGKREFEILLQPANLGKLAIKVAYESGKAMVSIVCTNEKTMELISQNAKQLGLIMEQHMGSQTVVVVDHQEPDYLQQQAGQQNQAGNGQQEDSSDQKEKDADTDSLSFLQQLRLGLA